MTTKKKNDEQQEMALATTADAPAYLTQYGAEGAEERLEIQSATPRLKAVQPMTDREIKSEHGEGAIVCMPDSLLVAEPGQAVTVIPVWRWLSWQTWADPNDRDAEIPVLAEDFDPGSELARKARNPREREEPYEGGVLTHRECIHMILSIEDGPAAGLCAVHSWMRAGHKHGAKLSRHIDRMGEAKRVPIYGNRIRLVAVEETNANNQTYWVVVGRPDDAPFVAEDRIAAMRDLYKGFQKLHEQATIKTAPDA